MNKKELIAKVSEAANVSKKATLAAEAGIFSESERYEP